jgi:hypothetical protein
LRLPLSTPLTYWLPDSKQISMTPLERPWKPHCRKNGSSSLSSLRRNWFFQWTFCSAAATIVSGGVAERVNFLGYCRLEHRPGTGMVRTQLSFGNDFKSLLWLDDPYVYVYTYI